MREMYYADTASAGKRLVGRGLSAVNTPFDFVWLADSEDGAVEMACTLHTRTKQWAMIKVQVPDTGIAPWTQLDDEDDEDDEVSEYQEELRRDTRRAQERMLAGGGYFKAAHDIPADSLTLVGVYKIKWG